MRVHIKTSRNDEVVDFNYQSKLVGTLHKWLGQNQVHDSVSQYSFSWLRDGKKFKNGLTFRHGSHWFISFHDIEATKQLVRGIQEDPEIAFGMYAQDVMIQKTPDFKDGEHRFNAAGPIFIKRSEGKRQQYYFYDDLKADELLTETFRFKLSEAGIIDSMARVRFDRDYPKAHTKKINYKGIGIKASLCPVIVSGKAESIAFAWDTGIGSSTGIGFGALV